MADSTVVVDIVTCPSCCTCMDPSWVACRLLLTMAACVQDSSGCPIVMAVVVVVVACTYLVVAVVHSMAAGKIFD